MQNPQELGGPPMAMRALKSTGIFAVILMAICCFQLLRHFAVRDPSKVSRPSKQAVISAVQSQKPKASQRFAIRDEELRDEVTDIERRLAEARMQKEREEYVDQARSRKHKSSGYNNRLESLEHTVQTVSIDQPGLAGPLQQRLEAVAQEAPNQR